MGQLLRFRLKDADAHWQEAFEHYDIPEHTKGELIRYIDDHLPPGHFLTAVLGNQLFEAMWQADALNRAALRDICKFIYNQAPADCWGDLKTVKEWVGGR